MSIGDAPHGRRFAGLEHRGKGWVFGVWGLGGTSQGGPEAVKQAVGGGCQSGWRRTLSVTNALEAGTCRQGVAGHRLGTLEGGGGGVPWPPFQCIPGVGRGGECPMLNAPMVEPVRPAALLGATDQETPVWRARGRAGAKWTGRAAGRRREHGATVWGLVINPHDGTCTAMDMYCRGGGAWRGRNGERRDLGQQNCAQ